MRIAEIKDVARNKLDGKWGSLALVTFLYNVIQAFGNVALIVLSGPLELGYAITIKKGYYQKDINTIDLFDGFGNFKTSFFLGLLNFIFVLLWSILLIIPGIIAYYSYSMSFYILNDNPIMTAREAQIASKEMMKGHKWKLFCLHLSFICWFLLDILTLGILTFWIMPYVGLSNYEFYERLRKKHI